MNRSVNIIIQEITDREQWNAFVSQQQYVHIMQSYEWGELNQYLGARVYRLGALVNDQLIGVMQLHVVAIPLPILHLNYLYCIRGPVLEMPDSPALPALVKYAQTIAHKEHAIILRIDPNIPDNDAQVEDWLQAFQRLNFHTNTHTGVSRRSWVLDLRPSAETLLANFKTTWRQNVRSSQRKGVTIREATSDADFDTYYHILSITGERDNFFIHNKDYHKEMFTRYKQRGQAVLFLAEHEGEAIATKMLIKMGDWCWDMFGGSSNSKRNLRATYLIQYHCFLWAKEQGCSFFDFRAIPNILEPGKEMWGVYEFKKGFDGFSRLVINTQDYVYNPLLYKAWNKLLDMRRARRQKERSQREMERLARAQQQQPQQKTTSTQSAPATPLVAEPPKVESSRQ
ncbi:lipid II:glycine glycyltransferase FemX [Dictyobacter formicarum]|uniref:Methicillin resistance protein n=1 Tax=Dictyobacter formicarum TaxID=2778368 RepID=A0ABQ3VKH3_9CHLR|nr:peptidoglycan bridge formation glycyltransferase FemA/FemB family protein [Dictyobacter formicarum]GHO86323.1 methicillin resistance protein [Dictyobacter formicarum]